MKATFKFFMVTLVIAICVIGISFFVDESPELTGHAVAQENIEVAQEVNETTTQETTSNITKPTFRLE